MTSRLGKDGKIFFTVYPPPLLSLSMHCILILSFQGLKPSLYLPPFPIAYCTFHHLLSFTISAFNYLPLSNILHLAFLHVCLSLSSAFHFLPLFCTSIVYYSLPSTILLFFTLHYPCLPLSSAFHFLPLFCTSTFYYPLPSIPFACSTLLCLPPSFAFHYLCRLLFSVVN